MATIGQQSTKEMSWLPEQHEEQLQLAFRIIDNSFKGKVHSLEQEIRALRLTNEDNTAQLTTLKKKNSNLECELLESHQRSQQLAEENKELFKTVSQLKKQIFRLEDLKKKVMSSLNDEEQAGQDDTSAAVYMSDDYLRSAVPITATMNSQARSTNFNQSFQAQPNPGQNSVNHNNNSQSNSFINAPLSPTGQQNASQDQFLNNNRSTSPTHGSVDGRMFFRSARARLSYEAFNAFLANIKRLNNHQQTRDETLEEAKKIFGGENEDLYRDFVQLLNRHA